MIIMWLLFGINIFIVYFRLVSPSIYNFSIPMTSTTQYSFLFNPSWHLQIQFNFVILLSPSDTIALHITIIAEDQLKYCHIVPEAHTTSLHHLHHLYSISLSSHSHLLRMYLYSYPPYIIASSAAVQKYCPFYYTFVYITYSTRHTMTYYYTSITPSIAVIVCAILIVNKIIILL